MAGNTQRNYHDTSACRPGHVGDRQHFDDDHHEHDDRAHEKHPARAVAVMRPSSRGAAWRALLCIWVLCAGLTACAREQRTTQVHDDIYERSSHELSQPPEAAAACVARNATQAGYFASPQPLFGTSAMSVSVRTFSVGDTLVTLSLLPRNTGSRVTATTLRERRQPARAELLETLLKTC